jgi:heptosyltransferase-1
VLPCANQLEQKFCEALRVQLGEHALVLPRMNLPSLLNEMATCQGVIGVDAGPSHMAVALGLPHVQIFSHDRAWRAGPVPVSEGGVAHQVAVGGTHLANVDDVWRAWLEVCRVS